MKKFIKIVSILSVIVLVIAISGGVIYYFASTAGLNLSEAELGYKETSVSILDGAGQTVNKSDYTDAYVELNSIPVNLQNAFISIEDKRFYKHNGLDYVRIAGAMISNIKTGELKEGASTISQQLIKNTHLSSEKSFSRKLKEARLAMELEKKYNKEEILEMYLNVIYFGNSVYGVENAAERFYGKSSSDLTLSECALLAGIVKNPAKYSPVKNYENSIERRNLVLGLMLKQNLISEAEYEVAISETVAINYNPLNRTYLNSYLKNALIEAAGILNITVSELKRSDYTVITYMDAEIQNEVSNRVYNREYFKANNYGNLPDCAALLADNETRGIIAYCSTFPYSVYDVKRQPGSAIKPLAVYAPALDNGIISPATQIFDEKTDFGGYSPSNYNDVYYGWVSARTALAHSLNVPAVKTFSYLGTDKALGYLNALGFNTENEDSSLSIALGGTRNGATMLQMTAGYMALANGGKYGGISFVQEIKDSAGKTVYSHSDSLNRVFKQATSALITDMLITTAESGTASKLSYLGIDVAAKTGTVAASDKGYNTDAWSLSYTTENTLSVWQGASGMGTEYLLDSGVTGGSYPTMLARDIYRDLYRGDSPEDFIYPEDVIMLDIDKKSLEEEHLLKLTDEFAPDEYRVPELFSIEYAPKEYAENKYFSELNDLEGRINNGTPELTFTAEKGIIYTIEREIRGKEEKIDEISGEGAVFYRDESAQTDAIIKYTVTPCVIKDGMLTKNGESAYVLILTPLRF
jgi:penicillin-binding protein 2A